MEQKKGWFRDILPGGGVLSRYLFTYQLQVFFIAGYLINLLFVIYPTIKVLRRVVGKDVSLLPVFEVVGHITMMMLSSSIPFALLFSSHYVTSRLSTESGEFMAMRASGLSLKKLIFPFVLFSTLVGGTLFALNSRVIPYSYQEYRRVLSIMASEGLVSAIRGGDFFSEIPGLILFVEEMNEGRGEMKNIFIRSSLEKGGGGERVIFAKRGLLSKESSGEWGVGGMEIELEEGSMLTVDAQAEKVEKILFQRYRMPLPLGELSASFKSLSGMKSLAQLYHEVQNHKGPLDKKMRKNKLEFYSRYNASILCLIMALFGFALGVQQTGSRSKKDGLLHLFIFGGVCQIIQLMGYHFGARGIVPPFIGVFTPSLIYGGIAFYFLRRFNWKS